ncbi:hypothetical protein K440DRAFT_625568 [Wilcoxina mikolae CBS 423.85]|nr:hypothetical protein K440DRAFT_625568 [Wilcoxina mikolae CBS 423.85]
MALLHQLPTEILLIITDSFVTFQDLYSLLRTSRRFRKLLQYRVRQVTPPIFRLPPLLLQAITGGLKLGDLNSFVRTNRYLYKQGNGSLYKRAIATGTINSPATVPPPVFDRIIASAFKDCPPSSIELFLDHGLDVNTRLPNVYGGRGPNLLCIAVFYYREALISLLISRGADVNADAYHGSTLLYTAMLGIRGHGALFSTFPIEQRADLSGFDEYEKPEGVDPRGVAIIKLLLFSGADPYADDWLWSHSQVFRKICADLQIPEPIYDTVTPPDDLEVASFDVGSGPRKRIRRRPSLPYARLSRLL